MNFFEWLFLIGGAICMVCAVLIVTGLTMQLLQHGLFYV